MVGQYAYISEKNVTLHLHGELLTVEMCLTFTVLKCKAVENSHVATCGSGSMCTAAGTSI
jgi:hypothetical protein